MDRLEWQINKSFKQDEEIISLRKFIEEKIKQTKNNHGYHGDDDDERCGDEDCLGCEMENQYCAMVVDIN
jgi:hypothetical protein